MNAAQELWWQQALSDHHTLLILRRSSADPCQQLHYLQMATEKLSKAYFWRSNRPPALSHAGFATFLRALGSASRRQRRSLTKLLQFRRFIGYQNWVRKSVHLAYALERLAPALAGDGPNAEYPWPQADPRFIPATYEFALWRELTETARGRQFLQVVEAAVESFPAYA